MLAKRFNQLLPGFSIGLITALLGGAGVYVLSSMHRLTELTPKLYQHPHQIHRYITHIEISILSIQNAVGRVHATDNPIELQEAIQVIQEHDQTAQTHFQHLLRALESDPTLVTVTQKAQQQFVAWQVSRNQLLGGTPLTAHHGQITEGLSGGQYPDESSSILQTLQSLDRLLDQRTDQVLKDTQRTSRRSIILTIIMLGSGLSLSLLWTVWLLNLLRQRQRQQQAAEFAARRLEILLALPKFADDLDEVAFLQRGQEFAEELTQSKIAFIHFVNEDQRTLELVAWSKATLEHYCHATFDHHYPIGQAGIWADAFRQQRAVIINDYAHYSGKQGLPQGHAHLERLISVPVISEDRVVMLTGVGNKATPYTQTDVETVQLIANELWRISQSKRLLQRLASSERRYRQAQAIARFGNWEINLQTQSLYWSPEVFAIMGVQPEQFGNSLADFLQIVHPEDRQQVQKAYEQSVHEKKVYDIVHRIITPQGIIRYVREFCATYYDEADNPVNSVGVVQDVTEQSLANEKLREAAAVFRNTSEGVVITNLAPVILDINKAFTEITGYSRLEVVGRNPRVLSSGYQDPSFYQQLWQAVKNTGKWQGEVINRRKDGSIYHEKLTIDTLYDPQGLAIGYVGVFSDISEQKATEAQLSYLAHHDALTGLPNRLALNLRLQDAIQHNQQHQDKNGLAVLFLDLDRFKQVNDGFGHHVGDRLLKEVAQRLQEFMGEDNIIARFSGDEFVLIVHDVQDGQQIESLIETIMAHVFTDAFALIDCQVSLTGSIGIALYPQDGATAEQLLRNADTAMYQAKQQGGNDYCFYHTEMTAKAQMRTLLENAIRTALRNQEFSLFYQPKFNLREEKWQGMEVLLRWQNQQQEWVSPSQFIPVAEQSGLILDIGAWVLKQACVQAKQWLRQGVNVGRIAVNLSGLQLENPDFAVELLALLEQYDLSPDCLELEVTESCLIQQQTTPINQLRQLQEAGITIAIDDFGTGYSSLSYLKQLPIDILKIDQSFIQGIPQDPDDVAIARAIVALGKSLELEIVAEGVETADHVAFLKLIGCDYAQGYFYSPPVPPANIASYYGGKPHQGDR